jgi:hypothetical protein
MFVATEGTIEINLEEFWVWVAKQHADMGETLYGVPRVNKSNKTIEIDFAASTDGNPVEWAEKPKALKQWDELK